LIRHCRHILDALCLAEGPDKPPTLHPRPPQNAPLREDDGPGKDAEGEENQQNRFRDRARLKDEIRNLAPNHYREEEGPMHLLCIFLP
jgi:hypothetical protein